MLSAYEIHEHLDSTSLVVSSTWALNAAVSCKSDPALAKEWGWWLVTLAVGSQNWSMPMQELVTLEA